MDQEGPRTKYNKEFHSFVAPIVLNDNFMRALENHYAFQHLMDDIKLFNDDMSKKCRIFGEFTLVRDNCAQLARMLDNSGSDANVEAATKLRMFNLSEPVMAYSPEIYLNVEIARSMRTDNTNHQKMDTNARGEAWIFVTIPELYNQAERFRSIFQQLLFNASVFSGFTIDQVNSKLNGLAAKLGRDYSGDAFVMMFIGHGGEERIFGSCGNTLRILDIVTKLDNNNCKALRDKPKMFIFDCCRGKYPKEVLDKFRSQNSLCQTCHGHLSCPTCEELYINSTVSFRQDYKNENEKTYVIYSCAEGFIQPYYPVAVDPNAAPVINPIGHVSVLGQALSHTIAQYSWYKSLYQLLLKTIRRVEQDKTVVQKPEIRMFAVDQEIYFNPGIYIESNSSVVKRQAFN